jgi:hypothetical protein
MLRDIVGSIKSREMDGRRLKQAIDTILDFLLQFDGNVETTEETPGYQEGSGDSLVAGLKRPSKSERRILLPPPDASS